MLSRLVSLLILLVLLIDPAAAAKKAKSDDADKAAEDEGPFAAKTFAGLKLRSIGPAITSGRIGDIAVHPRNKAHYYVAVASGGVWKTTNSGTTWTPIFDGEGSYSIGCVTVDSRDPLVVWVGTGENNSQRSVSYGDGIYKSVDGGTSWAKKGLENSEHISKIVVDPRDSNTVWVAAQGPLWAPGGERGLYRTQDGGETWELVLEISENTGVTDVVLDPRNPDVIYAAAYQRRRRVWTLIDGGPESAIYKSVDGGANWNKLTNGLPKADLGRIGLALSLADPDVLYAIVEAERDEGGFFRSVDAGANWEKRSDYVSGSPQYYQEILADPHDVGRVYSLDTWMMVTEDGGKTFSRVGNRSRHVDDHALWIDADDTDHLRVGGDGGVYESWDRGKNWRFMANLPVTQFYKVTPDNATPFYNVYGGTQDNYTLGGPARTLAKNGAGNRDWYVTLGGDGFEPQIDPDNPDIVYSQYQYGGLSRFDKRSGERLDIQPQVGPDEDPLRWNWDSALIISPHLNTRLYFAAQRVFRSDDRGSAWTPISGDLSRQLDRNQLEAMGRIQKVDAVAKSTSTSQYGNIVSMSESTLTEGLIYVGTDDGLIQVLEPETGQWRKTDGIDGIPELSYVGDVETSRHDADTVYAAFDVHKDGDFRPYLMKSTDRGRSWTSIVGDLPERGSVHTVVQDHVRPELLFAGTEFGAFFTVDGGQKWIQLKGGMPVIAVRDLEIQRRENDLVLGTFGRGIYILDDYTPLRSVDEAVLEDEAQLFPVKDASMYIESQPIGGGGKGFLGDDLYMAPNPPFGAVITYYLKDSMKTRLESRLEREKKAEEEEQPYQYPSWDDLRAERLEEKPAIVLTVRDGEGRVVRRLTGPASAGMQRVTWDLRYPASNPVSLSPPRENPFRDPPRGPMVAPGNYTVSLAKLVDGKQTSLGEPQRFAAQPLGLATLAAEDKQALLAFQQKTAGLQRAVLGAVRLTSETQTRIDHLTKAVLDTPEADARLGEDLNSIAARLDELRVALSGDPVLGSRNEPALPSIVARVQRVVRSQWASSSAPTQTNIDAYEIAGAAFETVLRDLRQLVEVDLAHFEAELEKARAPWTPGRVPQWSPE
jgi:photosystem II stability/assembly factor-like uncharacterized protein